MYNVVFISDDNRDLFHFALLDKYIFTSHSNKWSIVTGIIIFSTLKLLYIFVHPMAS